MLETLVLHEGLVPLDVDDHPVFQAPRRGRDAIEPGGKLGRGHDRGGAGGADGVGDLRAVGRDEDRAETRRASHLLQDARDDRGAAQVL